MSTRGSFGQPLFQTPAEHELYLALYERYAAKFGWTTLAWSLLRNHHHFLIKLRDGGLSEGMRAINHGFSRRLNAAYGRTGTGHLVRHSFFAQRIDTDECLRSVMRYIDLNAVAARCCRQPEHWPWCSYPATAGLARARAFHDVRAALAVFGARPGRARTRYVRFVLDGMPGKGYEAATGQRLVVRSAA